VITGRDWQHPDLQRKHGRYFSTYLLAIGRLAVYNTGVSKRQPLQEPTFLILTALAAGAQHGYGIMTDVAQISDNQVRLRAGTLYAALDRLLGDEMIAVDREEIVEGRLRRYYRLTPQGADLLAAEVTRMQANARVAARRLKNIAPGPATALGQGPEPGHGRGIKRIGLAGLAGNQA